MLGVIVNAVSIVVGSLVGLVFKKFIHKQYQETIIKSMALVVFVIGVSSAMGDADLLVVIGSLVVGSIIGEAIKIETKLEAFGIKMGNKFSKGENSTFSRGFVTTTLIYCVGAMAILGSLESGLSGKHDILFTKSALDGISSIFFASTLGIGVMFSAIPVFLYQGFMTVTASSVSGILTEVVITNVVAVGGILIMGISLNILEIAHVRVGNMLPAIAMPVIYFTLLGLF